MLLQMELCKAAITHQVVASIHIDDLSVAAEGLTYTALRQKLGDATRAFRSLLVDHFGLPLAVHKWQLLASHKDDEQQLRTHIGAWIGAATPHVRRLGVDHY
jgi:hypothetical protein